MTERSRREGSPSSRQTRREFVIGDGEGCRHTNSDQEYLGHHGPNAYYRCRDCDAVIVRTVGEPIVMEE